MAEQTTGKALEAGEQAAITPSVIGWGVFGWAFALVAIPMVYMRSGVLLLRSCPLPHAMYFFRTFSTPSTINSERFTFR